MRKTSSGVFVATVAAVLLSTTVANAGFKFSWPVAIVRYSDGSAAAVGSAAAARGSADSNQEVRCTLTGASVTVAMWDSANNFLSCQTTDAALIAVARTFTSDSGMRINVDASGVCTGIYVYNWSSFAPKAP